MRPWRRRNWWTRRGEDCTISPESPAAAAARLRRPAEIRARCADMLAAGERGALPHFDLRTDRLGTVADVVADVTRERYPDLAIPWHSRWRHFEAGGIDRWGRLASGLAGAERARVSLDLLVPSVLLDAGTGGAWRFRESATGKVFGRSEGLAVASFSLFASGGFSSVPEEPLRTDAVTLCAFDAERLACAFQAGDGNRLEGLDGRAQLLRSLGQTIRTRPDLFGGSDRVGGLFDHFRGPSREKPPGAADILETLVEALGPVWPGRIRLDGNSLGDVWRHRAVRRADRTDGLVPFHKLCQWLAYSLVEPFGEAGLELGDIGALTGLAEYRNGGLLIDGGVLVPRDAQALEVAHAPGEEIIVEWRALTTALLDRLAPLVGAKLNPGGAGMDLPLPRLLEGGTWAAGRRLAAAAREGGGPPIRLASDGTVF